MDKHFTLLDGRELLAVSGEDRGTFLQGLVSNDVTKVTATRAIYAALLTPQGKYLHDFFIFALGETLYLDAERGRLDDLRRRLSIYRLRSKVRIGAADDSFAIAAAFGEGALQALGLPGERGTATAFEGGLAYVDPRLSGLGARLILPRETFDALERRGFTRVDPASYDRLRLEAGVPDGSRDLVVDKSILLESGFDELDGVDWQKGCYMGQELTARTKYRGLIRKRLMPVRVEGPLPPPGTLVMLGDKEAGEMRSGRDGLALALLRLEAVETAGSGGPPLLAGEARLTPAKPSWARF